MTGSSRQAYWPSACHNGAGIRKRPNCARYWCGRLPVQHNWALAGCPYPGNCHPDSNNSADRQNLEGLDVGELTDAGTQVSDGTLARPDLAVYDRERKERVLMEAKFWAGLTENQPNAYLARLPLDQRPAVLLFVAPEARLETLWPELRRADRAAVQIGSRSMCRMTRKSSVRWWMSATRYLVLASWRALLNRMLSFAMSSGDSIEADIRQLHALCEQQDQEAFLPLKPHELAPEIPRRMLQYNQLVDDAVELATERDIVNTDRLNVTAATSRLRPVPAPGQQGSRCLGGRVVRGRSHALGQEPGNAPLDHLPLLGRRHYCR